MAASGPEQIFLFVGNYVDNDDGKSQYGEIIMRERITAKSKTHCLQNHVYSSTKE